MQLSRPGLLGQRPGHVRCAPARINAPVSIGVSVRGQLASCAGRKARNEDASTSSAEMSQTSQNQNARAKEEQRHFAQTELAGPLKTPPESLQSAPILGSLVGLAYLVWAGRSNQDSRNGLLLEMAGGQMPAPGGHVPSAHTRHVATAATSTVLATATATRPGSNGSATMNKDAELTAALQVAAELEAQVARLADDVREREQQLSGLQENAAAQTEMTRSALKESQRKVALLEAMVRALRERLSSEEARSVALTEELAAGQKALGLANAARQEAEARVSELKQEVTTAMALLEQAEARSRFLEQRVADLTVTATQLQARVVELEQELAAQTQAAAKAARQAELRIQEIQNAAVREASETEALRGQLSRSEAELWDAKQRMSELERSLEQANAQAAEQSASGSSEVSGALEEVMQVVAARERQVDELKAALGEATAQVEAANASKARELAAVRQELEGALASARQEVEVSNQQLAQMRQEFERVLSVDLDTLLASDDSGDGSGGGSAFSAWQAAQAAAEMRQLTSRQQQLSQEIRLRSQALDEQAQQIYPQLQGQVAVQAEGLRSRYTEIISAVREAEERWERDGSGAQKLSQLKRDAASVATELAALLRTAMSPAQRARERGLRSELADRETELRGINAQIMKIRQQYPPVPADPAGVAAAGDAANVLQTVSASGQLPAALAKRLRELLRQREEEAAAAARAREAELERGLREREQAVIRAAQEREQAQVAQMRAREQALAAEQQKALDKRKADRAAIEAKYREQIDDARAELAAKVKESEAMWNKQLQQAQQAAQASENERQRLAAELILGSVRARQQLSELAAVREELALRSRQLTDVKHMYENSKAAMERRAASAAAEAALVAGQVAVLQKALQDREVEVSRLLALEQATVKVQTVPLKTPGKQAAPAAASSKSSQAAVAEPPVAKPPADTRQAPVAQEPVRPAAASSAAPAPAPAKDVSAELAKGRELFASAATAAPTTALTTPSPPTPSAPPGTKAPAVTPSKTPAEKQASQQAHSQAASPQVTKPAAAPSVSPTTARPPASTAPVKPAKAAAVEAPTSPPTQAEKQPAAVETAAPAAAAASAAAAKEATVSKAAAAAASQPAVVAAEAVAPLVTPVTKDAAEASTSTMTSAVPALEEPAAPSSAGTAEEQPAAAQAAAAATELAEPTTTITTAPPVTTIESDEAQTASVMPSTTQADTDAVPEVPAPPSTAAATTTTTTTTTEPPAPKAAPKPSTPPFPTAQPSNQWGQPKAAPPAATPAQPAAEASAAASTAQPSAEPASSTQATPSQPQKPARAASPSIFPDLEDLGAEITRITQTLVSRQQSLWPQLNLPTTKPADDKATTPAPAQPEPPAAAPVAGTPRPQTPVAAPGLQLVSAGYMMPHVAKVERGGEDAFFVTHTGVCALGVTDGVGGWAADGVDVAEYARGICDRASEAIERSRGSIGPQEALQVAQSAIKLPGSCTAIVAILREDRGVLEVANLGDCGVKLLRGGRVVGATAVQEHAFNMPYQIADPDSFPETDMAADAQLYSFPVQPGDVIVMASDGLWDNLWDEQMLSIVSQTMPLNGDGHSIKIASRIASRLTKAAHIAARDPNAKTPWAVEAAAVSGSVIARMFPRGGKMDDITVVAAIVGSAKTQ